MIIIRLLRRFDWRLLTIFLLVAAIVHLITTFMAVNDRRGAAYARAAREYPENTMTIAKPVTPESQILPFLAPDARYAFCPFETADTVLHVKAMLPDVGWTISIFSPDGTNVYSAAAGSDRETPVDLLIVPADNRFLGLPPSAAQQAMDTQQTIAAPRGLIVVRGPDRGEPYKSEVESVLAKASCSRGRA